MTKKLRDPNQVPHLSPQQKTALWLFACGNKIKNIGALMGGIGQPTVKEHLHRAYRALDASGGTNAVHLAYEWGIFKTPSTRAAEKAIERVQHAALKLGIMSNVSQQAGLAAALGELARDLNLALVDLEADTAESPRDGMARALENFGIHGVNPEFLGLTYEGHPDIEYACENWDWADSEVADRVLLHCVCDMLGMNPMQYEQALENNRDGLFSAFWAAHEVWV